MSWTNRKKKKSSAPKRAALKHTKAIKRLRRMKKRIRIIQGGTSAGKTYGIIPILIDRAIKTEFLEISVVSETMPHLKKGAVKDFKKIMQQTGRWKRAHWHESDKKYTFSNGSYIEFFSADNEDRVRGPRRNVLYVNEANNLKWETYYQLAIRTDQEIYIDYNPTAEFWVHEELIGLKHVEFLRLTYKDNDALAPTIVQELESNLEKAYHDPDGNREDPKNIKSKYWANWCRVYLFGLVGMLEGVVFSDWKQCETIPPEARLMGYGLDFGYTNDPTVLMAAYKYNGKMYYDQVVYQTGLKTRDLADLMKEAGVRKDVAIYCDSADPKYRDELNEYGYSVISALKGADSIKFGISLLQQDTFYVTKKSIETIKELRQYCWKTDKNGKQLNAPIDAFNHAMDALRYFAMMMISRVTSQEGDAVTYSD